MSLWNFFRRNPQPGRDWSVTLPTTATTNQFNKYLEEKPSGDNSMSERTIDMFEDRIEELNGRIKELEAELAKEQSQNKSLFSIGIYHQEQHCRLRKAIETADAHYKGGFSCGHVMHQLAAALSPSPAAAGSADYDRGVECEHE